MAAAMRGCEYEYVAERERGLQTVARTSSYRYRSALPLCGGLGLFFNPAPALTELSLRPKIIGAHMAEISIQEIEAPAHASAIATVISVRAESWMPGIGRERRAKRVSAYR